MRNGSNYASKKKEKKRKEILSLFLHRVTNNGAVLSKRFICFLEFQMPTCRCNCRTVCHQDFNLTRPTWICPKKTKWNIYGAMAATWWIFVSVVGRGTSGGTVCWGIRGLSVVTRRRSFVANCARKNSITSTNWTSIIKAGTKYRSLVKWMLMLTLILQRTSLSVFRYNF